MNKKLYMIPFLAILAIGLAFAAVAYYKSTATTLVVNEARSSADMPLTINGYSGETTCRNVTIQNAANVPLDSILSYVEDSNPSTVSYTSNIDGGLTVTTPALTTETYPVCFTISETSEAGTVDLTINYQKTA